MKVGTTLVIVLSLLAIGCDTPDPGTTRRELAEANRCRFREAGSRWAAHHRIRSEATATFGESDDGELGDLWGITSTSDGDLLVFDAGNTRVLGLTPHLAVRFEAGGEGRGPGEFIYQRVPPGNWISAGDSSFYVLHRAVSEFDLDGGFLGYPTRVPPFPLTVKSLSNWGDTILFVTDEIDQESGSRELRTWRLEESGEHTLLRTDSMPPLPRSGGRLVRGIFADQAEPLWANHQECLFLSDGAGDWIARIHLPDMRVDTIRLPARPIPSRTPSDEAEMARLRTMAGQVGISTGNGRVEPTARLKWESLIVDPDGYIWLEPWRPQSQRGQIFHAWIVEPATGALDSVALESFPGAFVGDRGFVSTVYDSTTGAIFLRRYGRRPPPLPPQESPR